VRGAGSKVMRLLISAFPASAVQHRAGSIFNEAPLLSSNIGAAVLRRPVVERR
jgi:hypothetical protein